MYVFRLREPYPVHNQANGQEKARADLTPTFINVLYYILNPKPADVQLTRFPDRHAVEQAIAQAELMPCC